MFIVWKQFIHKKKPYLEVIVNGELWFYNLDGEWEFGGLAVIKIDDNDKHLVELLIHTENISCPY